MKNIVMVSHHRPATRHFFLQNQLFALQLIEFAFIRPDQRRAFGLDNAVKQP
ncbi:MAG: hypothetical protein AB7E85_08400 [Pseudobdellovibrionaceae bacterium]